MTVFEQVVEECLICTRFLVTLLGHLPVQILRSRDFGELGTEDKYVLESEVIGDPVSCAVVEQLCHHALESQHLSLTVEVVSVLVLCIGELLTLVAIPLVPK